MTARQEWPEREFPIGAAIRYRPGNGTYGYEESLESDGRVPGIVEGFTRARVRVRLTLTQGGVRSVGHRWVEASSLIAAAEDLRQ